MLSHFTELRASASLLAGLILLACGSTSSAQEPSSSVEFAQRPAEVGDRVVQDLEIQLELNTTITQAGQIASQDQQLVRRRQERLIEVEQVVEGRVQRAQVAFRLSREQSPKNDDPTELATQPVEGKIYFVTRDNDRMLVTDPQGAIPPEPEYEIVINNLKTLGQHNPLAKFLVGCRIAVGEQLQLPREIAEELLGFGDQLGRVEKFQLELMEVKPIDDQPCAIFRATIASQGRQDGQMQINVSGTLTVQTTTCRTVGAELTGPLKLSAIERTPGGSFQYDAAGDLRIGVHSRYSKTLK